MNTDLDQVHHFYEFWMTFQTWRDFKVEKEYELTSAENSFEKREMLKDNKRLKKAH